MLPGTIGRNVRGMAPRSWSGASASPANSIERSKERNAMRVPRRAMWFVTLAITLAIASGRCAAQEPPAKIPAQVCLGCHG